MTTVSHDKARRSRLPAQVRRHQLLDVARDMIIREGTEAVTMESVASAAGVSKTLGYAYFENRTELLLALFDREVGRLYQRATREMEGSAGGLEVKFRAAIRVWFDVAASEAGVASLLLQSSQFRGRLGERRNRTIRQIEGYYGHMVAKEYGIPEERAVVAVAALLAALVGVIDRWRATGEPRELVEGLYLDLVRTTLESLRRS